VTIPQSCSTRLPLTSKFLFPTQSNIRKTNEGRNYRICEHCNKTIDLHEPQKLINGVN